MDTGWGAGGDCSGDHGQRDVGEFSCLGSFKRSWKKTPMPARMIFYLRCAAYLRPLPRTHQQQKQLLAQTHSRGRARRNSHDENFPTIHCLELFSVLFYLHYGAITCRACINGIVKMHIMCTHKKQMLVMLCGVLCTECW